MPLDFDSKAFAPIQTWLPPWGLSACIRAALGRNTQGMTLSEAQQHSHYPVTPLFSINVLFSGFAELAGPAGQGYADAPRQRLPALSVSGPQTKPLTVVYGPQVHGVMMVVYPDAWQALTGLEVSSLVDRVVDARDVLPADVLLACERLLQAQPDDARVQRFFADLLPVWQRCAASGAAGARFLAPSMPSLLGPWMEALALRAAASGWGRSVRQSERRIKQWTGWSMRRLQVSARGESVFFAVMEALNDDRLDWTQIALDHGFSDQSHFIRETRRLTGFSPEAMRHGVLHEEAFWSYRAWAKLAGL